jgi:hypothetical protein
MFEGEQHGFRKAENIQRALEAELYFYSQVFGFTVDGIEPVHIDNLPARAEADDANADDANAATKM